MSEEDEEGEEERGGGTIAPAGRPEIKIPGHKIIKPFLTLCCAIYSASINCASIASLPWGSLHPDKPPLTFSTGLTNRAALADALRLSNRLNATIKNCDA
ncbi:hypothetical protein FX264_21830 [Salmonella enterica]|nr:hypothetical protein [Salmonella enterica]